MDTTRRESRRCRCGNPVSLSRGGGGEPSFKGDICPRSPAGCCKVSPGHPKFQLQSASSWQARSMLPRGGVPLVCSSLGQPSGTGSPWGRMQPCSLTHPPKPLWDQAEAGTWPTAGLASPHSCSLHPSLGPPQRSVLTTAHKSCLVSVYREPNRRQPPDDLPN